MFASLFASTSQGISYPFLYLNSAASPLALLTDARASAMEPVITQPTEGESLKMCETEDGSMSLSCTPWNVRALVELEANRLILLTGTFFCERTTAQSLPRTPIDVIFAAVMALNAYSDQPSD